MSKTKHTPGPWTLKQSEGPLLATFDNAECKGRPSGAHRSPEMLVLGDSGLSIACIPQWSSEANAALIAAAPELLEALERITYATNKDIYGKGKESKDAVKNLDLAYLHACNIIDKAKNDFS